MDTQRTYTFHVNGMHCKACVVLIDEELQVEGVTSVYSDLKTKTVTVTGDFNGKTVEEIAEYLTKPIQTHGYTLSLEKKHHQVLWGEFVYALPIALLFIGVFIILQKLGLVNMIRGGEVNYLTVFIIGLVASVSTCMAVVGGLVLSMSANFAKDNDPIRPQVLFHIGRLASFFILGGTIGTIGSMVQFGVYTTIVLNFVVAGILLILGINLLDILPWAKKFQLSLPSSVGKKVHAVKSINHTLTPLLVGVVTFFLPCGFTQSMQLYTLTTGSFLTGSLTMLVFALGTLPVLSLLSFSSLSIHDHKHKGIFFKAVGIIVVFFGVFNLINALVLSGAIQPLFNF